MKKIQNSWYSVGKKIKIVRYTLEIRNIIAREVIRNIDSLYSLYFNRKRMLLHEEKEETLKLMQ